jgi:uracil-DNA glycosylase family 4
MSLMDEIFQSYTRHPAFAEAMGTKLIAGRGHLPAAIVVVGEAPDDAAARMDLPFAGPSSQMLTQFLTLAGLPPATLWFTNVVKLRPYDPGDKKYRHPSPEEIAASLPYLRRELNAVEAEIVLALGTVAGEALTGQRISMTHHHGLFFDGEHNRPVFVTHHPGAAMFRGPAKQEFREDILHFAKEIRG